VPRRRRQRRRGRVAQNRAATPERKYLASVSSYETRGGGVQRMGRMHPRYGRMRPWRGKMRVGGAPHLGPPDIGPEMRHSARRQRRQRKLRYRYNHQKPVASPTEDSLPPRVTRKLIRRGYVYSDGKWLPPSRQYNGVGRWPLESGLRGPKST
jgi:hypothetical protein